MPPRKNDPAIDLDLILPARQEHLREQARDKVALRLREEAEKKLLEQYERDYERELNSDPNEEYRNILIDLPGHTDHIRIDRDHFHHGRSYEVKASVYDYLMAQMQACWAHETEIGMSNREYYTKPRVQAAVPGLQPSGPHQLVGGRF